MKCPKCDVDIFDASRLYHCHPSTGRVYGVLCYTCGTVFLRDDGSVEVIGARNE